VPLGIRDNVVALQLFDLRAEKPLVEESAVAGPANEALLVRLGTSLAATDGPPLRPPVVAPPTAAVGVVGWIGAGVMLLSVIVGGVATTAVAVDSYAREADPLPVTAIGASATTVGAGLGLGLVALDVLSLE
jgi:hypothetical protein